MRLWLLVLSLVAAAPAPEADAPTHLSKRAPWPNQKGTQLYAMSGSPFCLITGDLAESTTVYVADCTNTNFPGWFLPEPGSAGLITLANTQFCLDAGPDPKGGVGLMLRACSTTGPSNPTIGNAQRWWGLQANASTDYWIELAGKARIRPEHTKLCVEARDGYASLECCSPSHDKVTFVNQLWSPTQHG